MVYALQCLRRLFEDRDMVHSYNGLRYFLTIIAVVIRTCFELKKGLIWEVLTLVSSIIATMMNTYWDIIVDWGLLQRKSKNLFLRDKLVVSHKSVYFAAMVNITSEHDLVCLVVVAHIIHEHERGFFLTDFGYRTEICLAATGVEI